jgi:hypothetical protein
VLRSGQAGPQISPVPDASQTKLRHILKNVRKRYRQFKEILATENILDAKKVRFMVNLLLPKK